MINILSQVASSPPEAAMTFGFVLLGVSILVLLLELVVPSGGLLALLGGVALVGSVVAFFMHDISAGFVALGSYIVFGPFVAWAAFKVWINSPLARRMVLGGETAVDPSSEESFACSQAEATQRARTLDHLIGTQGVTETVLRPVGVVRIDGSRYDALAESGVIETGTAIIVTEAYDNQLKVRTTHDAPPTG